MKHTKKDKEKSNDSSDFESKRAEKINQDDNYLSYNILKEILKECKIPKKIIEEKNSELFYETLTGKGTITFINNMKYHGLMKNGLLESGPTKEKCQIIFPDGTKYEGEIHQNKITGKGRYIFPSGSTYEGNLLNGLRHGEGKYASPEGITYEGEWKNGLKDGKGIMKRDTMIYDGEWKEGRINGNGKIKWANGNLFEGHFKMNHIDGNGFMVWYDLLEKYIGRWKNDKQNGFGMNIWYEPKGELKEMRNRYVGEWEDGIKQGYGIFFYSNGAIYEGEWKNNMKHGFGIMIFEDGKRYIGRFEEDRILDRDNQLNFEKVKKLMKEYQLNKINNLEEHKEKSNSINNIYQIIQMKKNSNQDLNQSNISIKKKEVKKLNSINLNKLNSKSNIVNSKDISKVQTLREPSAIAEEEDENKKKSGNLRAINNVSNNPINDKSVINNKENKKDNLNNTNNPMNKTSTSGFGSFKLSNLESLQKLKNALNSKAPIFIPHFDLSDLIQEYPSIKYDQEEISKVILRNLSLLKIIYRFLNKIANSKLINEDTNSSKIILKEDQKIQEHNNNNTSEMNNTSKSQSRKKSNILNKSTTKKTKQMVNPPNFSIAPIKLSKIEDNIRSDEISFCISMLDVWDFLRDRGVLNEKASICEFDRIFSLGTNTMYENFILPEGLNEPDKIYKYIYQKINESKNNFIYKYKPYLEYYYRQSRIPKAMRPKSKTINSKENQEKNSNDINNNIRDEFCMEKMHDKRRVILPRIFHECLIRAALLLYMNSKDNEERNMQLSKKLQKLLNILFPQGVKKKSTTSIKSSHSSRLEQSFNTSVAVIDNKTKIQEYCLRKEFMSLFYNNLKRMFNKFHEINNINKPKNGDKTILYSEFYYKVVLYQYEDGKENLIRKLVQNKFAFIDLITNYFKEKTNLNSEENRKDCTKLYDYFNSLFNREMIEFEFNELIFLLCKKYIALKCLRGTINEYQKVVIEVENIINKLEKPKNTRKKYFYPTLQSHIIKQRLIDEERRRIEEERRRKLERQRYMRERELMDKEEKVNAFNDKVDEEDEESVEDLEEDLF